ncbi:MAG: hypothetical protein KKD56_08100 [Acidobacteria bacterium]|nr:hypothetical protein [Acidobacteriota bacterium]MBU1475707.1 hypothetical protein [Acidobacteriota bacterium]
MEKNVVICTGREEWDGFFPQIRSFLEKDSLDLCIDGETIRGYRSPDSRAIWIRDHSDILRGAKYIEKDMRSAVDHFAHTQAANGRIFDYVTTYPDKLPSEKENWTKYVRVPVEADVEYRFIKAAWLAWQATGDDEWIEGLMPYLIRAVNYITTSPLRWDDELGLVKRPYTIDTWDFAYTAGRHDWLQMQIDENTFWGIMHGDNSGYYEAFSILSRLFRHLGRADSARCWSEKADSLRIRMNEVCWNGRFYTHFVKRTPVTISGVDESEQLSLSNPININRGAADHKQAVSIINEYRQRKDTSGAFAEWFSIHPPFPAGIFGDDRLVPGAYINGGIFPLVGGELARAAFEHGFERYGVEILRTYRDMIRESGETYLWYFPDGTPSSVETSTSPEATPTDGWGSSAMLYAFLEGLAGIEDRSKLFERLRLAPRWPAANVESADVRVTYAASGRGMSYSWRSAPGRLELSVEVPQSEVDVHLLLPDGFVPRSVSMDGRALDYAVVSVESSAYTDFSAPVRNRSVFEVKT